MIPRLFPRLLVALPVLLAGGCSGPSSIQKNQQIYHRHVHQKAVSPFAGGTASAHPKTRDSDVWPRLRASSTDESFASDIFPKPPALETQVAFWRNVYCVWSRSQVVLHDNRFLDVIYEVVQLPGEITEGYTASQKELISERKAYWQFRLRNLEEKLVSGQPLTPDEQQLALKISPNGNRKTELLGASERLRVQRGLRERFKRGLEISGRYDRYFRDIFRQAGLPEDLAYLPHVESSFQTHARSSAGAVGVWQFTRGAAERFMNVNTVIDERLDPIASAQGAARYLRYAYEKLGSWPLAITSYNHGISGMIRAKQTFGHDFMRIISDYDHPQFGFASRNFYAEFLAAREIASQPERFFAEGIQYEKPLDWDRIVLTQSTSVSALARQYNTDKSQLIALNTAWSGPAKSDRALLPAGTVVWLPSGTLRQMAYRSEQNRLIAQQSGNRLTSPQLKVSYSASTKMRPSPVPTSPDPKKTTYKLVKARVMVR